jgi:dipeptidyl aminopeptidase/acylaminoacyl peptidase
MRRFFLLALCATGACLGLFFFVVVHGGAGDGHGGLILYRDGDVLYTIDAAGGHPRRLSPRGVEITTAQWSPDGHAILQVQEAGLWVSDPDGTGRKRLARGEIRSSTWAPDSTQIALVQRIGLRYVLRIVAARSEPRTLVRFEPGAEITTLAWARPARITACDWGSAHAKALVIDVSTAALRSVGGAATCGRTWLREGRAYLAGRPDRRGNGQLWLVTRSEQAARLTNDVPLDPAARLSNYAPSWSPDGSRILFFSARRDEAAPDLFVVKADGRGERRLTHSGNVQWASWSPDGSRVALARGNTLAIADVDSGSFHTLARARVELDDVHWQPPPRPPGLAALQPAAPPPPHRVPVEPTALRAGAVRIRRARPLGPRPPLQFTDLSPGGRLVAFVNEHTGAVGILDLRSGRRRILARGDSRYARTGPYEVLWNGAGYFSPDAKWLLYRVGGQLRVVSPEDGRGLTIAHSVGIGAVTWLRDGRVAYTDQRRRLFFVRPGAAPVRTGFRIPNPPGRDDLGWSYAVKPNGRILLYGAACRTWLLDLGTHRRWPVERTVHGDVVMPGEGAWAPDGRAFVGELGHWDNRCRELDSWVVNENRLFSAGGRRLGILPRGGTSWSRDGRWLLVFDSDPGNDPGNPGEQPLYVISVRSQRISELLRIAYAAPAFVGPGRRLVFGRYRNPGAFAQRRGSARPELWLGLLERWLDPAPTRASAPADDPHRR